MCALRYCRQLSYAYADEHRTNTLLPKLWHAWTEFVAAQQRKRAMQEAADAFHWETLATRCLTQWRDQYERSCDARMHERMAILHCDSNKLKQAFQHWRKRTDARLEENFKQVSTTQ